MAADLGSLFESHAALVRISAEPAKGSLLTGKSAEAMAMEAYAARAEGDALVAEAKNLFIGEYGIAAWDQVLSATTQIKKDIKAAALDAEKEQEAFLHSVVVWGSAILSTLLVIAVIFLIAIGLVHR